MGNVNVALAPGLTSSVISGLMDFRLVIPSFRLGSKSLPLVGVGELWREYQLREPCSFSTVIPSALSGPMSNLGSLGLVGVDGLGWFGRP